MKVLVLVCWIAALCAQPPPGGDPHAGAGEPAVAPRPVGPGGWPGPGRAMGPHMGFPNGPPLGLRGLPGKWWQDANVRQRLGLTDDQRKKMEAVFLAHRLKLIDLNAALQRDEAGLEPLLEAEQIDEAKAVAQSDRVAQARAELEKANARFLIGIRRILTPEQWRKMEDDRRRMAPPLPGPPPGARPAQD